MTARFSRSKSVTSPSSTVVFFWFFSTPRKGAAMFAGEIACVTARPTGSISV